MAAQAKGKQEEEDGGALPALMLFGQERDKETWEHQERNQQMFLL